MIYMCSSPVLAMFRDLGGLGINCVGMLSPRPRLENDPLLLVVVDYLISVQSYGL